jgi:hypothetical protein
MNITEHDKILGVPEGILYGQNARVDELNDRILGRFIPSAPLQPNIDFRPVPTKYAHFPVIDRVPLSKVPVAPAVDFSVQKNFLPATDAKAPVSGYFSQINTESALRNQYFAIQRGDIQGVYVPSSTSDLYSVKMAAPSLPVAEQTHPLLFDDAAARAPFLNFKRVDPKIGSDKFFNNTRTQLRTVSFPHA